MHNVEMERILEYFNICALWTLFLSCSQGVIYRWFVEWFSPSSRACDTCDVDLDDNRCFFVPHPKPQEPGKWVLCPTWRSWTRGQETWSCSVAGDQPGGPEARFRVKHMWLDLAFVCLWLIILPGFHGFWFLGAGVGICCHRNDLLAWPLWGHLWWLNHQPWGFCRDNKSFITVNIHIEEVWINHQTHNIHTQYMYCTMYWIWMWLNRRMKRRY